MPDGVVLFIGAIVIVWAAAAPLDPRRHINRKSNRKGKE